MPDYQFGGQKIAIPTAREIAAEVGAAQRVAARGFKWLRIPALSAVIASNAVTAGITQGEVPVGPNQGYAWSLMRLVISGLTSGTTPDTVNLYRSDNFSGAPLWQFNGNNFGYTFSRLQMVLMPGDTLSFKNSGSIAATGTVTLTGECIEVPAEMLWKLI